MDAAAIRYDAAEADALQRRDPAAVERWFREHADALFTFALRRAGGDRDVATDVVQEVFVTALRQIGDYDPTRGAMFPWLTYRARNALRKVLGQRGRLVTGVGFDDALDPDLAASLALLGQDPLPDEHLARRETADLVHETLWSLSPAYRDVLTRHYCDGQPLRDIASADATSESAVKSLLHRARQSFRAAFTALVQAAGAGQEVAR